MLQNDQNVGGILLRTCYGSSLGIQVDGSPSARQNTEDVGGSHGVLWPAPIDAPGHRKRKIEGTSVHGMLNCFNQDFYCICLVGLLEF